VNLSDLDPNNPGSWPLPIRLAVVGVIFVAIVAAGWYLGWSAQIESLKQSEAKESELKLTYSAKLKKAVNLDAYEKQLEEMRKEFGAMLRQLPGKSEIEALIEDFSQTGLASGLEFELFKRGEEQQKEFYAEMDIKIRVVGSYHEFGAFVSGVAALPRIVTLHNVTLAPRGADPNAQQNRGPESKPSGRGAKAVETVLSLDASARTYRYLDESEITQSDAQGEKK
jgi:type IV pilus assembly protein PilO